MNEYSIEIRDYHGHMVTTGRGHTEWQETLLRLAARAGIARPTDAIIDDYFTTGAGAPWGTHHVQFGAPLAKGELSLGNTFIVQVRQLAYPITPTATP